MTRQTWTTEEAVAFGRRLVDLRRRAGLSQRDLVVGLPLTAAYVSRIENGERYPSVRIIRELAGRLRVSADYLEAGVEAEVAVAASASQINDAAGRWGVDLRWEDLDLEERAQATQGLDTALVDALAARIHAIALNRSAAAAIA